MKRFNRFKCASLAWLLLAAIAMPMLSACGGGGGSSSSDSSGGTSSLTFQVVWDRPEDFQRAALTDCLDVDTVRAAVLNSNGDLITGAGPWSCAAGDGVISGLQSNDYVTIAVEGYSPDGVLLYYGQNQTPIFLSPGNVDAGMITAGSFVPTLLSPASGATVAEDALELRWRRLLGANGYRVTIASDAGFESIVDQIVIDNGATTSVRPDTTGLSQETPYYWRVRAVSARGGTGAPSLAREFILGTEGGGLDVPELISPANGSIVSVDSLELVWTPVSGASGYRVTLARDDAFTEASIFRRITIEGGDTASVLPLQGAEFDLLQDFSFFWQVEAISATGAGDPSAAWRFHFRVLDALTYHDDDTRIYDADVVTVTFSTEHIDLLSGRVYYNPIEFTGYYYESDSVDQWSAAISPSDYLGLQEMILGDRLYEQTDITFEELSEICYRGGESTLYLSMSFSNDEGEYEFYIDTLDREACRADWPEDARNLVERIHALVDAYRPEPTPSPSPTP